MSDSEKKAALSNYISPHVFRGTRPMSPAEIAQMRAAYKNVVELEDVVEFLSVPAQPAPAPGKN